MGLRVLLLTNELATVSAVTAALKSNGGLDPADVCRNLGELTAHLERGTIPAVLVDFDQHYAAVATYMGVDAEFGVLDLLNREGPIDAQLIQSTVINSQGRAGVLLGATRGHVGDSVQLDPRRVGMLVDGCKG